ncbi:MAG: transcription termination/antitermination protein NusG [Planctomycetota bacterium]
MTMQWYVLRVQSNREKQVAESLQKRVKMDGLEERIMQIVVPSEQVTEIRGGKRRVTERKIYPGYIMVQMDMDEDTWFLVRETPGIGDFVGAHLKPVPMQPREVEKMLGQMERRDEEPKLKIDFKVGDTVKIKEGPFENFDGIVEEVIPTKGLVRVVVTIFGRATRVELEYWKLEAV